jgi:hypothetical protein
MKIRLVGLRLLGCVTVSGLGVRDVSNEPTVFIFMGQAVQLELQ